MTAVKTGQWTKFTVDATVISTSVESNGFYMPMFGTI